MPFLHCILNAFALPGCDCFMVSDGAYVAVAVGLQETYWPFMHDSMPAEPVFR